MFGRSVELLIASVWLLTPLGSNTLALCTSGLNSSHLPPLGPINPPLNEVESFYPASY